MVQMFNQIVRRPKAILSSIAVNVVHLRNPLVVAWWSLAYPGLGHLRLSSNLKGLILFVGELLINAHAHINLAIIYSFTGRFNSAKTVLNNDFLVIYCGILIFSVWDSYRLAVENNKLSVLADHENAPLQPVSMTATGLNALDKRNPWLAVAWSALAPGLGHLYTLSISVAIFMLATGGVIIHCSHLLPAIHHTAVGNFTRAKEVLDWQWLLNIPSIYCFSMYDSYVRTVELNKIFEKEQARYFQNTYQSLLFKMPL